MLYVIITLLILVVGFFPQLWVRYILKKYSRDMANLPGTGGELARHLADRFELADVVVEEGKEGQDHYDPAAKTVRLSPSYYNGKSITAVAVAAHEIGHAIQFNRQEPISRLRGRYIPLSIMLRKVGLAIIFALPILSFLLKAPAAIAFFIGASLIMQLLAALLYLIVLPEEWDASFNKALPLLIEGDYLPEEYLLSARSVLKAAALTYFASALADILNIGRWFLLLRR